jgi:phosphocarrier protein
VAELSRNVVIVNELGLHARAASKLVQLASTFPVEIEIGRKEMMVNSKSIMGVLMLAAGKGTELAITAKGDEGRCEEALSAIEELFADRFGEAQ